MTMKISVIKKIFNNTAIDIKYCKVKSMQIWPHTLNPLIQAKYKLVAMKFNWKIILTPSCSVCGKKYSFVR